MALSPVSPRFPRFPRFPGFPGLGANQRQTTYTYNDTNQTVTTVSPFDPARTLTATDTYDARGRLILTQVPNASCTQATIEHRYLTSGGFNYELASNPYCVTSETTMGWTRTKRDTNGRVVEVATYPGATPPAPWDTNAAPTGVSTTDYTLGDKVDSTDPAGKTRRTRVDGLGRMVEVIEDPNGVAYSTTYGYDLRDGLISVTQTRKAPPATDVVQNRTFTYDSLGRLSSAYNVEGGTTSYTYDPNGNVLTTTLAGGPTRTYTYNTRNQITSKTYSTTVPATPTVYYCYDGKIALTDGTGCATSTTVPLAAGRLTGVGSSASVTNYTAYDYLGRIASSEQWVDGVRYPFTYAYLAGGQLSYEVYPSGTKVNYAYNNAGQATTVGKGSTMPACPSPTCYAHDVLYAPHGAIGWGAFGASGTLTQTYVYNSRLQLTDLTAATAVGQWVMHNDYGTTQNNGNLLTQTVNATGVGGVSVTANINPAGYDAMNRLLTSGEGGSFGQSYGYDSVGNRWVASGLNLSPFTPLTANWFDGATNRLTSVGYDSPGNLTTMGGYGLTYDAEGRQSKATIGSSVTQYWYDGDGRRVKKQVGTGTPTVYVYDAGGELVAEYGGAGAATGTQYLVQDHLGSTRMVVGSDGHCQSLHDYLPYGEEIARTGTTCQYAVADGVTQKFTGKERDAELASSAMQGLDYFDERYFSAAQGRFTSVDPQNAGAIPIDPQSWNGYAYGRNNPLKYTDPTGTNYTVCDAEGKNCRDLSDKQYDQYLTSIQKTNISVSPGGNINYQNTDGSVTRLGTAGYYNEKDVQAAQFIANQVGPLVNGLGYATLGVVAGAQLGAAYGAYVGGNGLIQLGVASGPVAAAASNPTVQATIHGAERLAERGFSAAEVALTKTGQVLSQADGARVYIKAVGDRFNVIVEGERGVVTALKNISQKSLDRLSRNYGWK